MPAPDSSELNGAMLLWWQTPRGQYLDDNGLSWASKSLAFNCSALPHVLAGVEQGLLQLGHSLPAHIPLC